MILFASRASVAFLLQAASAPQAGKTSAEKTTDRPSFEKRGDSTPPGNRVFCSASPPPSGRKKTCGSPVRVETKASVLPSGEKKGCSSRASPAVIGRAFEPSASTRQSATVFFFAAQSFVVTE